MTPPSPPKRPAYLAPLALGLALLTGIGLHYQPDFRAAAPVHSAKKPVAKTTAQPVKKISHSAGAEAKNVRPFPARNTRIAHSESCVDCESFYVVHDGKGGRIRRSEGYTTRCCTCGSTVAFSDGYYYEINCEGKQMVVKMGKRISDAD